MNRIDQLLDRVGGQPSFPHGTILSTSQSGTSKSAEQDETDPELEDTVQEEQEYLRERLRSELGREPTEQELNDWLREHTESY